MKAGIRNLAVLLGFLALATLLVASRSRTLGLVLGLGFYAGASSIILVRTARRKPGESYLRQGWGHPISVLPATWQHWLLDGKR